MATPDIPPEALELASRMYNAARQGHVDVFEQALPAGLPANMTNEKGDTLVGWDLRWRLLRHVLILCVVYQLMLAAYHGHAQLVKLLMDHGADPNRVNDRGQSPLAGAVFKMEDAVVEVGRPVKCQRV